MVSKAFGEQNPTQGETAVSWQTWSDGVGGIPNTTVNIDWGKLSLQTAGAEGRSAVYDLGSAATRKFTLTENRYGTGSGVGLLQIRGDTVAFTQDDNAVDWETYTAPVSHAWRYVQVRETTFTYYYMDATLGDDAHPGTKVEPWQTVAKVNATSFLPGDHILFKRGETWRNEVVTIAESGTFGHPIYLGCYGSGALPIFDGSIILGAPTYKWTVSANGTNEYYLELAAGGNPGLTEPKAVQINNLRSHVGTMGSLTDHYWDWGNNDTLGFNTVYVRDNSGDPDTSGVVIEGVYQSHGVTLSGNYITVNGLHITKYDVTGIYEAGSNQDISYCTIDKLGRGIDTYGGNNKIHHNTIQDLVWFIDDNVGAQGVDIHSSYNEIYNNTFSNLNTTLRTLGQDGAAYSVSCGFYHYAHCSDDLYVSGADGGRHGGHSSLGFQRWRTDVKEV